MIDRAFWIVRDTVHAPGSANVETRLYAALSEEAKRAL